MIRSSNIVMGDIGKDLLVPNDQDSNYLLTSPNFLRSTSAYESHKSVNSRNLG